MARDQRLHYSDPNDGKHFVFDKRMGEFREPTKGFVPTLPLDPIAEIRGLPGCALPVWMLCHFLYRCNHGNPFNINRHNAAMFSLSKYQKLTGLAALQEAGFIEVDRGKGRANLVQLTEKGLGHAN
jgi:hypothetical protein